MTDLTLYGSEHDLSQESSSPENLGGARKTSETSKTVNNSTLSNQDFLAAIFESMCGANRPILVSFPGSPNSAKNTAWQGKVWHSDSNKLLPVESNNYFSLATFSPDGEGVWRRRKEQFAALHALMLDDIGTKVNVERLTLLPTWMIETSPGNHQVGYMFVDPLTDVALANKLMKAIIAAGLSDPGSSGPTTRLARLPVGCNGKHTPSFVCRLVEWHPERRYTVEQLMLAYGAEGVKPPSVPKGKSPRPAKSQDRGQIQVWVPESSTNRVIEKLESVGLYKRPLGAAKHDISCPWKSEHTGGLDSGAAYFEPDKAYPAGGFKCLHGHCANRHLSDLLEHLDLELADARQLPTIRAIPGKLSDIVNAAEQVLAQSKRYFQRGGLIVSVSKDASRSDVSIQGVSEADLLRELAASITWERLDEKLGNLMVIDPPARYVANLFNATSFQYLPPLLGIARQPYLRTDGSIIRDPGYDRSTMMYGAFDPVDFSVPERPTRADVQEAVVLLESLLAEFAFQDKVDKAAALSAILTATIRPSLSTAPMFHVRAHTAGSGKSYLCELIATFATEQISAPAAFPTDNDECRKFLLAELLRGPAVITFDNLTSDLLAHRSLCTALTSEYLSDRVLGISKTATVSTRTLFLSSGNNVRPIKDMTRRTVTINLDPGCETPATRSFKRPNLIQEVQADRAKYVSAALTVIRACIQSDQPEQATKILAGFHTWTDWCVEPLLRLGYPDPVSAVVAAMSEDPDRELLGRFIGVWYERFGSTPTMVRELVDKAGWVHESNLDLREALHEIAGERGEINRRKLGWWIKRHEGQVVGGRRFQRTPSAGSAEKWRVEVLEVLPVSFAAPDNTGMKDCD